MADSLITMADVTAPVASFNSNSEAARARREAERTRILREAGLPEDLPPCGLEQDHELNRLLNGGRVAL